MSPSTFLGLVTLCAMLSCVPAATTLSDCDSFLAGLFPSLYPHCASNACKYGPWSDWFYTGKSRSEPTCTSGNAGLHNRTRNTTSSGGQCERPVEYESKYVCQPTVQETAKLLVKTLELGQPQAPAAMQPSRRPPTSSPTRRPTTSSPTNSSRRARDVHDTLDGASKCPDLTDHHSNTFCHNILPNPRCKRSEESMTPVDTTIDNVPLEQFDLDSYLASTPLRMRRSCHGDNDTRYVLFILDTSGSIGHTDFDTAKQAIAVITNSLCGYIKVALMSFSHLRYLDFCFDCYPDEGQPRNTIRDAIMNTTYRDGFTHTADAIKCACEHMLSPACGPPLGRRTNNIDVVILTDGLNNGPCRSKLLEVSECLKNEDTINIFAIAIGGGSAQTVANLVKQPDYTHIFQVKDFTQLGLLVNAAEAAAASEKCIKHSGGLCG